MASSGEGERKILKVNPNDFLVSAAGRRSRSTQKKSAEPKEPKKIQVRDSVSKTVKNQLMKHLKNQQRLNYEKLLAGGGVDVLAETDNTDFGAAVDSMTALFAPPPPAPAKIIGGGRSNQYTFKRFSNQPIVASAPKISQPLVASMGPPLAASVVPSLSGGGNNSIGNNSTSEYSILNPIEPQFETAQTAVPLTGGMPVINNFFDTNPEQSQPQQQQQQQQQYQQMSTNTMPQWGCLKGGSLPTYRSYQRQTIKHHPTPNLNNLYDQDSDNRVNHSNSENNSNSGTSSSNALIKQMSEKFQQTASPPKPYIPKVKKQRKIVRRTYRLGKSKIFPRISVLVSNKTLRKEINDKIHAIQETPMHEVRNYLVKNGFIKVGSSAPNEVLRKMYENLKIINSEVRNHNTDTLLYNYLQGGEHS
jgi:hypothetical protein